MSHIITEQVQILAPAPRWGWVWVVATLSQLLELNHRGQRVRTRKSFDHLNQTPSTKETRDGFRDDHAPEMRRVAENDYEIETQRIGNSHLRKVSVSESNVLLDARVKYTTDEFDQRILYEYLPKPASSSQGFPSRQTQIPDYAELIVKFLEALIDSTCRQLTGARGGAAEDPTSPYPPTSQSQLSITANLTCPTP
ncbi:hypothetical protein INR49_011973 [Caranx melampygus]|nr:hypothetical protein INR49_011973 [Caranx melampygus]